MIIVGRVMAVRPGFGVAFMGLAFITAIIVYFLSGSLEQRKAKVFFRRWKETSKNRGGSSSLMTGSSRNPNNTEILCPHVPANLITNITIQKTNLSLEEIAANFPEVKSGGIWSPKNCRARHRVAIVVPYRDREWHLRVLLLHLHRMLQHQFVEYGIYVVELVPNIIFNRGMIKNIGFVEAMKRSDYQCVIFHDVDLIPEDERNFYYCPDQPRHMSALINTFGYKVIFPKIFGGVVALSKKQMLDANGYSNMYWGWGAEDDDLRLRLESKHYKIAHYPLAVTRYTMLSHKKEKPHPLRRGLLASYAKRMKTDGLNSLKYTVKKYELSKLFTWTLVSYTEPPKPKKTTTESNKVTTPNVLTKPTT